MKKFLVFLLVLIILAGTVFFLGWAQLTVQPGSYGVMRSKTHGLEAEVIKGGDFRWIWYKIIPKNAEVLVFNLDTVNYSIKNSGSLISGQTYASLAGLDADFSWEISGELSFSLKPETLPEMVSRENITGMADLKKAEEKLAERIGNFALERIKSYAETDEKTLESLLLPGSLSQLNSEISSSFPGIENLDCTIHVVRYPDYALYQSVKALYQEYLARQSAVLRPDLNRDAEKRIETRNRMDELTRYGELLTKYPILLQYLALEKGLSPGLKPVQPEE